MRPASTMAKNEGSWPPCFCPLPLIWFAEIGEHRTELANIPCGHSPGLPPGCPRSAASASHRFGVASFPSCKAARWRQLNNLAGRFVVHGPPGSRSARPDVPIRPRRARLLDGADPTTWQVVSVRCGRYWKRLRTQRITLSSTPAWPSSAASRCNTGTPSSRSLRCSVSWSGW